MQGFFNDLFRHTFENRIPIWLGSIANFITTLHFATNAESQSGISIRILNNMIAGFISNYILDRYLLSEYDQIEKIIPTIIVNVGSTSLMELLYRRINILNENQYIS